MNYTKTKRENYNIDRQRACERLDITVNQYNWLKRKANEISKLDVYSCNGEISDIEYKMFTGLLDIQITAYLHKINPNIQFYHQTDPRGASLYIAITGEFLDQSNYNSIGICIY